MALLLCLSVPALPALAGRDTFPGNHGETGLWDMPTARVMPDWTLRGNIADADRYRYWSLSLGLFDRIEVTGRLNEVPGRPSPLGKAYGSSKDKDFDVRILLLEESKWLPAVAIGGEDVSGTGRFTARYLALSKEYGPIDLSFGLGQGILAGESPQQVLGNVQGNANRATEFLFGDSTKTRPFGGMELHMTKDLSLVAEYSSISYSTLFGAKQNAKEPLWPINLGAKARLFDHILLSGSWLGGQKVGFGGGLSIPLEPEGMLSWKHQTWYVPPEKDRMEGYRGDNEEVAHLVSDHVEKDGFYRARASVNGDAIWVEFTNTRFQSMSKAVFTVGRIVDTLAPPRITWLYLAVMQDDMRIRTWKVHRDVLRNFVDRRLERSTQWEQLQDCVGESATWSEFMSRGKSPTGMIAASEQRDKLAVSTYPVLRTLLNDPSGFLKTSINQTIRADYRPIRGGLLATSYVLPFYNDISSSNRPIERNPARTDFVQYLSDKNPRLEMLAYDQVFPLPGDIWGRAAMGAFESAYMGFGAEMFRYFADGRFGVGVEAEAVKKRDINDPFVIRKGSPWFYTSFLNLYWNVWPSAGIDAGLKMGRFLAGDPGVRWDIRRTYRGFSLGLWYTATDTSIFVAQYNKGYADKGIYFSIPLSCFSEFDIPGNFQYSLSPWTRDPGQLVAQPRSLFPF